MIASGQLRHFFTVQRLNESSGDATMTPTNVAVFWGSLEGFGGIRQDGLDNTSLYQVRTRFREDLDSRNVQLVLGTRLFQVLSVRDPSGLRQELLLLVREVN